MRVTPIECPHGIATAFDIEDALPTDGLPELQWCPQCDPDSTPIAGPAGCPPPSRSLTGLMVGIWPSVAGDGTADGTVLTGSDASDREEEGDTLDVATSGPVGCPIVVHHEGAEWPSVTDRTLS